MALTPGPSILPSNALAGDMTQALDNTPQLPAADPTPVSMQNPYTVAQNPTPVADTRSFTQKLLGGLLAGAAGGAAADPTGSQGGVLGLHNAQQQEQSYQQDIARKNAEQQRGFENQLQIAQNQRENSRQIEADQLHSVQLADANMHQLDLAHQLADRPFQDQVAHAEGVQKIVDSYEKAGANVEMLEGSYSGLSDYLTQHPEALGSKNLLYIPGVNGGKGQVAIIDPNQTKFTADQQRAMAKAVGLDWPAGYKAPDRDFLKLISAGMLQNQKVAGQEELKKTVPGKAGVGSGSGAGGASPLAGKSDQEILDAIQNGDIRYGDLQGRGEKGQKPRVTALAAKQGVDLSTLEREDKYATQNQGSPAAIASLVGTAGNKGILDQIPQILKEANVSGWKQLNELVNKGNVDSNSPQGAKVLEARNLIVGAIDQYAKIIQGGNGASTDKARAQAETLFNEAYGENPTAGSVKGIKEELLAREKGMAANSRYLKRDFEKVLGPPQNVIDSADPNKPLFAPNGTTWHIYTDKRGNKRAERAD